MFVEGTLRWQVTEDCPWDLLMALALRDLGGLSGVGDPVIPRVFPAVSQVLHPATGPHPVAGSHPATGSSAAVGASTLPAGTTGGESRSLADQWLAWWEALLPRETRPLVSPLRPPHFEVFDRALDLQDLAMAHYETARQWSLRRHEEYAQLSMLQHSRRSSDIVDIVRDREHELRRQAGYFRLDIYVLPLAARGAWIVAPHTVVVSTSLRDDSPAFRAWFAPVVAALV